MALIQLNLMEQVLAPLQGRNIGMSEAMAPIEGENMHPVEWVPIEEICTPEWSIGGPAKTAGPVLSLAAGKK